MSADDHCSFALWDQPFIKASDWSDIRLRRGYDWLIPDHVDTTATNTLAAYDRIVVRGLEGKVENAGVFRYDEGEGKSVAIAE